MARILAVPHLANTTPEFRTALWQMAARNGWNVDALAAVMSFESGFNPAAKNPKGSATGIIQFTEETARRLGTSTAALRTMTAVQQLPYAELYYKNARAHSGWRPVDYYLALWGAGIGTGFDHVLAIQGDRLYSLNSGLDFDLSGTITTSDLDRVVKGRMNAARGQFIEVSERSGSGAWFPIMLLTGAIFVGTLKMKKRG